MRHLAVWMILTLCSVPAAAVKTWTVDTFSRWAEGTLEGTWIERNGIQAGPVWEKTRDLAEAIVTDALVLDGTLVVSTGTDGKIIQVGEKENRVLADLDEDMIMAMAAGKGSTLYFATAPGNALYSLEKEAVEKITDVPGEVRDLTWFEGHLYVATASPAAVLKLSGKNLETVYTCEEEAVACLVPDGKKGLLAGTCGNGLLIALDSSGRARVLWQDSTDEISCIAPSPDGTIYFVGNADPDGKKNQKKNDKNQDNILSVLSAWNPDGTVENLLKYKDKIILSLHYDSALAAPVFGMGAEGLLFGWKNSKEIRLADLEDSAVVVLTEDYVVTQESMSVYRKNPSGKHAYTSRVFDAGNMARLGEMRYRGTGKMEFEFRSGKTEEPGPTWTGWGHACASSPCSLNGMDRYAQFRVELSDRAVLERVNWNYVPLNLAPRITSFEVLDPGVVFLKGAYQPQNVVIQATNPDEYGIFTTFQSAPPEADKHINGKKAFMKGYRTFSWKVEDENGDELTFSLYYRSEQSDAWNKILNHYSDTFFSWDTMVLPDGEYRFKLTASDSPANPEEETRQSEEISEAVIVDNHPPVITFQSDKNAVRVVVEDELSPVVQVEMSLDGKPWKQLLPEDKISDSRKETFLIKESGMIVIRAMDSFYNSTTQARGGTDE